MYQELEPLASFAQSSHRLLATAIPTARDVFCLSVSSVGRSARALWRGDSSSRGSRGWQFLDSSMQPAIREHAIGCLATFWDLHVTLPLTGSIAG